MYGSFSAASWSGGRMRRREDSNDPQKAIRMKSFPPEASSDKVVGEVGGEVWREDRNPPPGLEGLVHAAGELSHRWPIVLRGSWASGEYHLVESDGMWDSLSDFDLVSEEALDHRTREEISRFLMSHAVNLRSKPAISFRTSGELGDVYSREHGDEPVRPSEDEAIYLVMFWLSIGIAESCSSAAKYESFHGCDVQAYFLNKLYVNAWRMLHHVNGTYLTSYADVLAVIPGATDLTKRTSLRLKCGVGQEPNTAAALKELRNTLMKALAALGPNTDCSRALESLGESAISSEPALIRADNILRIARSQAGNGSDQLLIDHSAAKLASLFGTEHRRSRLEHRPAQTRRAKSPSVGL